MLISVDKTYYLSSYAAVVTVFQGDFFNIIMHLFNSFNFSFDFLDWSFAEPGSHIIMTELALPPGTVPGYPDKEALCFTWRPDRPLFDLKGLFGIVHGF